MFERLRLALLFPRPESLSATVFLLILINLIFNIVANSSFRMSATSANWRAWLTWQVAGNLAGLATVLTLTALLRYLPLSIAFPLTMGLSIVGVQVVAARLLFHESISPTQWLGTALLVGGIWLIRK